MAGRWTGEVRKRLTGDQNEAAKYVGLARKMLGDMKNRMRLNSLEQLSERKKLQNCVEITVSSVFGQDTIEIYAPVSVAGKEKSKKAHCPLPNVPDGMYLTEYLEIPMGELIADKDDSVAEGAPGFTWKFLGEDIYSVALDLYAGVVLPRRFNNDQSQGTYRPASYTDDPEIYYWSQSRQDLPIIENIQGILPSILPCYPWNAICNKDTVYATERVIAPFYMEKEAAGYVGEVYFTQGRAAFNGVTRNYWILTYDKYNSLIESDPGLIYNSWQVVYLSEGYIGREGDEQDAAEQPCPSFGSRIEANEQDGSQKCPAAIGVFFKDLEWDHWEYFGTICDAGILYRAYSGILGKTHHEETHYSPACLNNVTIGIPRSITHHPDSVTGDPKGALANKSYWITLDENGYVKDTPAGWVNDLAWQREGG